MLGRNSRLDAIQAAVLLRKLPYLDAWNNARVAAADAYVSLLPPWIVQTGLVPGTDAVYHLLVVRVSDRDKVCTALADRGIGFGIHYAVPCHRQAAFAEFSDGALPICDSAAAAVVSLPMHPGLGVGQVTSVCLALEEAMAY
jgi:dTDP-4-amino-4,6-dideoxygalactose transaminase